MNLDWLDFERGVFFKALAIVMTLMVIGWVISYWYYGELALRDIIGSIISCTIFTYMVHLWIIYRQEDDREA